MLGKNALRRKISDKNGLLHALWYLRLLFLFFRARDGKLADEGGCNALQSHHPFDHCLLSMSRGPTFDSDSGLSANGRAGSDIVNFTNMMQKAVNVLPKGERRISQTGKTPVSTGIQRRVIKGGTWTHLITIEFCVKLVENWGEKEREKQCTNC